ncbi:MAG: peptidoglycan editing factor PgeF [Lautropia sp.]
MSGERARAAAADPGPDHAAAGGPGWLVLPAPPHPRVRWGFTLRPGGVSRGRWGAEDGTGGLNLGARCGDLPAAVAANRAAVARSFAAPVRWLDQVHGIAVHDGDGAGDAAGIGAEIGVAGSDAPVADAQITARAGTALAILVADCLPVLLADRHGRAVGAAHAGWRGLAGGVVEATVLALRQRVPDADLVAWLGPRIGPTRFEVGDDVRDAFIATDRAAAGDFTAGARAGKWWADLGALARRRLAACGITAVHDSGECTVTSATRYWSFRRDRECGRMAALISLSDPQS